MQQFRTTFPIHSATLPISHSTPVLCIGSCFAENIAQHLEKAKFSTLSNPFGIVFNPISIAECLSYILNQEFFSDKNMLEYDGLWHSFSHHSHFSQLKKEDLIEITNAELEDAVMFFEEANHLVITLGSAYIHTHLATKKVVANCHKMPAALFEKSLLSIDEIVAVLSDVFKEIQQQKPLMQITLTVSPIRHTRDGMVENQRSKATLLLATAQLVADFEFVHYFPAYELMMDDLRDYRFYAEDMIHPNETAIEYIWQQFQQIYVEDSTRKLLQSIEKVTIASLHRPFHPEALAHQTFIQQQLATIETLSQQYPFIDFSSEKKFFLQYVTP